PAHRANSYGFRAGPLTPEARPLTPSIQRPEFALPAGMRPKVRTRREAGGGRSLSCRPMPDSVINLYSDTQTRPDEAMRQAMANAEVGDEQRGQDPTVTALCEEVAELLGKEAAVFLPSGSMCNQIAVRLHIRPLGDEMYLGRLPPPITAEAGGAAAISGAMVMPLEGEGGMFSGATLRAHMRDPADRHEPRSRLVTVEQTTNLGGGRVWPQARIAEVLGVADEFGLRTHLDG